MDFCQAAPKRAFSKQKQALEICPTPTLPNGEGERSEKGKKPVL
jgi:hypothetical protein